MNKLFKPKSIRRLLLFMALIFPVVYLCGGLFFGLNGAHNGSVFAEPVYTGVFLPSNDVDEGDEYILTIDQSFDDLFSPYSAHTWRFDFTYDNQNYNEVGFGSVNPYFYFSRQGGAVYPAKLINGTVVYEIALSYRLTGVANSSFLDFYYNYFQPYSTLETLVPSPSDFVPENNSAFTDFVFSQPFASNNFISELGKGVISNDNAGFAPMNQLFYTINENVLHFDQNDKLAVFGYGYVYYAVNVLIVYEILILAVKLIMLPLKAVEVFDREER